MFKTNKELRAEVEDLKRQLADRQARVKATSGPKRPTDVFAQQIAKRKARKAAEAGKPIRVSKTPSPYQPVSTRPATRPKASVTASTSTRPPTPHLDKFESLGPAARNEYFREHRAKITAESSDRAQWEGKNETV